MFVFDNYSSYLMFFTTLGFIIHHSQKKKIECVQSEKSKQLTVIILIAIICVTSFFTIIKPYSVAQDLIKGFKEKDQAKILNIYEGIWNKNTFGTTEAGIRLISEGNKYMQNSDPAVVSKYKELTSLFGEQFASTADVRRLETYGSFLLQTGNVPKAVEVLEKAQALAPDRHNNLYTLGLAYIANKEIQKALAVFKHAYDILPENEKAKTYYGAVLLLSGDISGKELIKEYSYKDSFFLSIFGKTKQYKEVIKIREQLRLDNPTDYQNQVSLAVAYYFDKQPAKAIALIKEVQKSIPDFKGQGDALIRDIQAGRAIGK